MNVALIGAAGQSRRMRSKINKIFLPLAGEPVLLKTVKIFASRPNIDQILIITAPENIAPVEKMMTEAAGVGLKKITAVIPGGAERQDSIHNGLKYLAQNKICQPRDLVIIHNGGNPFVDARTIDLSIAAGAEHGAAVVARPLVDTIKQVDGRGFVTATVPRATLRAAQTPQVIRFDLAFQAFQKAADENHLATDDVSLIEFLGAPVKVVESNSENFKITTPMDYQVAQMLAAKKQPQARLQKPLAPILVGFGLDSHRFEADSTDPLVFGGVNIPDAPRLAANSDGDVLVHSLVNALSQAIGGRSISFYADDLCQRGIKDSFAYLVEVMKAVAKRGYQISNLGFMVEAKRPKFECRHQKIVTRLAEFLNIAPTQIGLTFTSGEGLTSFGRGEGIKVETTCALIPKS